MAKTNKNKKNSIVRIRQSLQNCNNKLKILLNITLAINSNLSIRKILEKFKNILTNELSLPRFILFWKKNNEWVVLMKSNSSIEEISKSTVEKLLEFEEIDFVLTNPDLKIKFDFIIPIKRGNEKVAFLLIGDLDEGIGMSPSLVHLQFVQTLTNIIIVAIQNRLFRLQQFKQKQLVKEMQTAAQIQKMLIPNEQSYPQTNYLKIKAFYMPHMAVGGDYYDIIKISKYDYVFLIADVSGKGVSAALLMANFQANLRSLLYNKPNISIEELVFRLNEIINNIANGDRFITMFLAKYNALKRRLLYVNAAHPAPLFYDKKTKSIIELKPTTVGLGMLEKIKLIKVKKLRIKSSSKLLCFTDGFFEPVILENQDLKQKIYKFLKSNISIDKTIEKIIEQVPINKENKIFFDDVAILGIEFFPFLGTF